MHATDVATALKAMARCGIWLGAIVHCCSRTPPMPSETIVWRQRSPVC
jgi:hypothetical protein